MSIILKRTGALGDVIASTAVLRRLRRENPATHIGVLTAYPDVFKNNPHFRGSAFANNEARLLDLDMAYEREPLRPVIGTYMRIAFGDEGSRSDWLPELFPPFSIARPGNAIAVHPTVAGWKNRTLPRPFWNAVIDLLKAKGYFPILVGTPRDTLPGADCTNYQSNDLMGQAAIIKACKGFVGSNSGLMWAAMAVGTPFAAAFTAVLPALLLPSTDGPWRGVLAPIECVGCQHRRQPPVTDEYCARGDRKCVELFAPEVLVQALEEAMKCRL